MNHWMFRCKDISQKVSRAMDAPLPWHERLAVEMHLLMCRYCARFRSQLRQLREICGQVDAPPTESEPADGLSEDCKNKIKAALRKQR